MFIRSTDVGEAVDQQIRRGYRYKTVEGIDFIKRFVIQNQVWRYGTVVAGLLQLIQSRV